MPTPGTNAIRILLKLLAAPYTYTAKQLGDQIGRSKEATIAYINNIEAAGINVLSDHLHRRAILPQTGFKELRYLSPLSDEDKTLIRRALQQYTGTAESMQLYNKLETLYDFQQLGIEALRRPELEKINALEEAKNNKQRVILRNYRSRTSNTERDRQVEAFGIEPEIGMVRAYDIEKQRTSHFMLRRIDRVQLLDTPWQYEKLYLHKQADAFNIVDDRTTMVQLTLSVSAYNDLVESHPQARQYVRRGAEANTYDFQARINHKFIGLTHYILANWRYVTVHGPAELKERLQAETEEMAQFFRKI